MSDDDIVQGMVDRTAVHYEYCFGSGNDSPTTWRVVLRFAGASADEVKLALRLLETSLVSPNESLVYPVLPDRNAQIDVDGTMRAILRSHGNCTGTGTIAVV